MISKSNSAICKGAQPQSSLIDFTLFSSDRRIGKVLFIDEAGKLDKKNVNFGRGQFEVLRVRDIDEFVDIVVLSEEFDTRNALAFGVPVRRELDRGTIVYEGRERPERGRISRTRACFEFPQAEPGVLFLDGDDVSDNPKESADALDTKLISAAPWFADIRRIYVPSSSSRIYETQEDGKRRPSDPIVSEKSSWHCYFVVDDADRIPDIGRALFAALIDAGHGRVKISRAGTMLLRGPIDAAVWQPERLDYAFGPSFEDDRLYQHLGTAVARFGEPGTRLCADDARRMSEEDFARWEARSNERARLFEVARPAAERQRAKYLDSIEVTQGKEARASYERAIDMGELEGDFPLITEEGVAFTVAEALEDADRYHGAAVRHPLEPEIRGKSRLYLKNQAFPCLHTFAHGGQKFKLLTDDEELLASMDRLGEALHRYMKRKQAPATPKDIAAELRNRENLISDLPAEFSDRLDDKRENPETLAKWLVKRGYSVDVTEALLRDAACTAKFTDADLRKMCLRQEQRERQIRENAVLGRAIPARPTTPVMTLREMFKNFVYLRTHQLVANRETKTVLAASAARSDLAASKTRVGKKDAPTFSLWMSETDRTTVDVPSWHPGEAELFHANSDTGLGGNLAFNTWRGLPEYQAPDDWEERVKPFAEHVEYLVPIEGERRRFMQWLAHMVQKPGELPHSYYCLIARTHGIGRNWLASALTRVLPGYVTPSVDLGRLLSSGFNGMLSQKLLAIVDEAHEVVEGGRKYENAKVLRRIITEEYRRVNPKYAPEHTEKNCLRWLMFSNYEDPLPIEDEDRRGIFIENPSIAREEAYYVRLYAKLDDPAFIASVRHHLQTLDIRDFNPGERAPRNEMKQRVIDAGKSELDRAVEAFISAWPGWFVLIRDVRHHVIEYVGNSEFKDPHLNYALRRAGVSEGRVFKLDGRSERVSVIAGSGGSADRLAAYNSYAIAEQLKEWRRMPNTNV